MKNILVTGGSGFIGANFIHYLFEKCLFTGKIINLDKLTYAGNPQNLIHVEQQFGKTRYFFEHADICDLEAVERVFKQYEIDTVIHFAAESHVDRSIYGPSEFIQTNIIGTFNLLETARKFWNDRSDVVFHHISTDEVFGSLGDEGYFFETTPYDPHSPYSASKAASDHLVMAYYHTYGLPVTMSNCSNNYGRYQFPEKLIPLMVQNMLDGKPLPLYGDGKNIRDWLFVDDHCSAIWMIINKGNYGVSYNIGGENEWQNIDLLHKLCELMADKTGKTQDTYLDLITPVKDRPGHDRRYAINCDKIKNELGWKQSVTFEEGLSRTLDWYIANQDWVANIKTGEYRKWLETNYHKR